MDSPPKVSIVIPVHNGSDHLREAIDSALAQSYGNVEVLVVNDGSDDGGRTEGVALSYGDRVRYVRKENGGVASALNRGIREMAGDYFSWLSHDDVYLPDKVEAQIDHLRRIGRDAVLYGDYVLVDGDSRVLETVRVGWMRARRFRMLLVTDIPVNGCTVLVPKRFLEDVGLFDERLRVAQDYDLWFRLAGKYPFAHVPRVLLKSRLHPGQGTRRMAETCLEEGNRNFKRFLDEMARERAPEPPWWLSRFLFNSAVRLKRRGYLDASRHALDLWLLHVAGSRLHSLAAALGRGYYAVCDRRLLTAAEGARRKACAFFR